MSIGTVMTRCKVGCGPKSLLAAAAVLGGSAIWHYSAEGKGEGNVNCVVEQWPGPDLGRIEIGTYSTSVRFRNLGRHECRIVGILGGCQLTACFEPPSGLPMTLSPGQTIEFPLKLNALRVGAFELPIEVYLDDRGLRILTTTVHGVVTHSGSSKDVRKE